MTRPRSMPSAGRAAARLITLLTLTWLSLCGVARADVTTLDGLGAPIVRVNIRQGDVTVRTWDRQSVAIDGDSSLVVERRTTHQAGQPYPLTIPVAQSSTPEGPVGLPAESFVVSSIPAGPREAVFIKSPPGDGAPSNTPVTVTVPNNAVFVFAHTNNGTVDVRDYRGGTLFASAYRGRVTMTNVGGAVFAQSALGPVTVTDSSFERFRARSLTGNVTFERCHARQIEATSVNGSIVYDGGTFEPGLARFESIRGDVAVGTTGSAQIGAHAAGGGRVYTNFEHPAHVDGHDGETNASVAGGGPVVSATTQGGNVYLYDGSLRNRGQLSNEWQPATNALERPGERAVRLDSRPPAPYHPFYPFGQTGPKNGATPAASSSARPNAHSRRRGGYREGRPRGGG